MVYQFYLKACEKIRCVWNLQESISTKSRISSFFLVQILPFQKQIGTKSFKRATSGLDFLKVVRMVFWYGVVAPGTLAGASPYALKSSTCEQV